MWVRSGKRAVAWIALAWLLSVVCASATDIKLKNGRKLHGVTILNRDAFTIEIEVKGGTITLTNSSIASIDGKPFSPPKSPAPSLAGVSLNAVTNTEPRPPEPEPMPYVHKWTMDVFLILAALLSMAWIGMLLWVQRDVRGTPKQIHRANADVLLLPGIGFVLYLISRWRHLREMAEPRTLTGRVAGLQPEEAPKKRGLFAGRTKITAAGRLKMPSINMEFLDVDRNPIQVRKDQPEMTGIEAAREVLESAMIERSSDVHLEPMETGYRVRFRVDGVLQERMVFEKADGLRVATALKALAQIDVAERRKAQDGRFRVRTQAGEVDFRVATTSSMHGEKIVMRILDRKSGILSLAQLGMPKQMMHDFDKVIHSRNGIILATGPTGSGKTSTLYAALSRLDRKRLNLMSIEDPVEYELEGATQIPVNPKAGVTYESGLRSIMRQDPDVIFVGEMRDADAARIAIRAALTGHLVFSSLHAKDAVGTIMRLEEMGVEKYQVSSAMLIAVGQRLVRVLCERCREPYRAAPDALNDLGLAWPGGAQVYRAVGCEACDGTGYQGRTGIFELLFLDGAIREAINEGVSYQQLFELALQKGFRTYHEDGAAKILNGITTVEEVLQAS
jgi:type II secretory ATPase GspE/PulE/Tfp pilus assembly ATPase PilB-like protein